MPAFRQRKTLVQLLASLERVAHAGYRLQRSIDNYFNQIFSKRRTHLHVAQQVLSSSPLLCLNKSCKCWINSSATRSRVLEFSVCPVRLRPVIKIKIELQKLLQNWVENLAAPTYTFRHARCLRAIRGTYLGTFLPIHGPTAVRRRIRHPSAAPADGARAGTSAAACAFVRYSFG